MVVDLGDLGVDVVVPGSVCVLVGLVDEGVYFEADSVRVEVGDVEYL